MIRSTGDVEAAVDVLRGAVETAHHRLCPPEVAQRADLEILAVRDHLDAAGAGVLEGQAELELPARPVELPEIERRAARGEVRGHEEAAVLHPLGDLEEPRGGLI